MMFFWLAVIIFFILLELATTQFISIWFAGGAFAALLSSLITSYILIQIIIFILTSGILLIFTRKFVNKLKSKTDFKDNVQSLIGQEALVIEPISNINATGTVKLRGVVWSARSSNGEEIGEGKLVRVVRIDGVKLIVNKLN